jgi:hypothetical protein
MTTTKTGLIVPDLGAPPNMLALGNQLDGVTVPVFATTAARDAAVTAGATFGVCFVAGVPYRLRAGVWVQLTDATDVAAIPTKAAIIGSVAPPAITLPAGGGTLGIGSGIAVTSATYNRVLKLSLDLVLATASAFVTITLQWNAGTVMQTRAITLYHGIHLEAFINLNAGASGTASATINCGGAASTYGAPLSSMSVVGWPA